MLMRYKDFIWPNNPYTCAMTTVRDVASHKFPGGGYSLEDMGMARRVLSGTGEFYGPQAYSTMKKLMKVFSQEGAGPLVHPVLELSQAIFAELELVQEPREDYVLYRFVFLEDGQLHGGKTGGGATQSLHVVTQGETLWEIAAAYGTSAQALAEGNPWIINPNLLPQGAEVAVV